ncbi:ABC transporter ATP-binding protein [Nocardia sp. NPDC058518]|uniref:ABC transporter ATP-binding protein n=1 Tax=Nocardia sp. NPDC058518 TaxID=3346534 RepID=UPI0036494AC9
MTTTPSRAPTAVARDDEPPPLLSVRGLRKHFPLRGNWPWSGTRGAVHAVDDVSFDLAERETLAIVGESGCGKSTTARLLLQLGEPTEGDVLFRGQGIWTLDGDDQRTYRRSVQAVFQDPSSALSPRRRVKNIVTEPLITIDGKRSRDAVADVDKLLAPVGLTSDVADRFPHQLSGGMKQRVAIAQALATQPSVIVLDEPVSALDVSTSAEILNLLKRIQGQFGVSYVLITHNLATVRFLAHQVAAMYLGTMVEKGGNAEIFHNALHPYTLALLSASIPTDDSAPSRERIILQGDIPSPVDPPKGCRFHTRCWLATDLGNPDRCRTEAPVLRQISGNHQAACHFTEQAAFAPQRVALLDALKHAEPAAVSPEEGR